jgi:hypothetical protein
MFAKGYEELQALELLMKSLAVSVGRPIRAVFRDRAVGRLLVLLLVSRIA